MEIIICFITWTSKISFYMFLYTRLSYFCVGESLNKEVLFVFLQCVNQNISTKGKNGCMVPLSLWSVTQTASRGHQQMGDTARHQNLQGELWEAGNTDESVT